MIFVHHFILKIFDGFQPGDYVNLFSVIINVILAWWLITSLQKRAADKRFIKEFFIEELKELKKEYSKFFEDLISSKLNASQIVPTLTLINVKLDDVSKSISSKNFIGENYFNDYKNNLLLLITEFEEVELAYEKNLIVKLGQNSINDLIIFRQNYDSTFNNLILLINHN